MHWLIVSTLFLAGGDLLSQDRVTPGVTSVSGATSVHYEGTRAVFVVTSARGIGRETLRFDGKSWPKEVTLRFQYEQGRGFARLESLELRTDRLMASWQPRHEEDGIRLAGEQSMGFVFADEQGVFSKIDSKAGSLSIHVEVMPKGLDIKLPANLLIGSRELKIEWVDMFR